MRELFVGGRGLGSKLLFDAIKDPKSMRTIRRIR